MGEHTAVARREVRRPSRMGKRPRSEQNKGGAGPTAPGGEGGPRPRAAEDSTSRSSGKARALQPSM